MFRFLLLGIIQGQVFLSENFSTQGRVRRAQLSLLLATGRNEEGVLAASRVCHQLQ